MEKEEIFNEIKKIVVANSEKLKQEEIKMDTIINQDSGVDSMEFILIICKIEARFAIKVSDRQWQKLSTMEDLVNLVYKKVNSK